MLSEVMAIPDGLLNRANLPLPSLEPLVLLPARVVIHHTLSTFCVLLEGLDFFSDFGLSQAAIKKVIRAI